MNDVQWVVFWGGQDPDDCAGWQVCPDEATAYEEAQWRIDSGIARREVTYSPWDVTYTDVTGGEVPGEPP